MPPFTGGRVPSALVPPSPHHLNAFAPPSDTSKTRHRFQRIRGQGQIHQVSRTATKSPPALAPRSPRPRPPFTSGRLHPFGTQRPIAKPISSLRRPLHARVVARVSPPWKGLPHRDKGFPTVRKRANRTARAQGSSGAMHEQRCTIKREQHIICLPSTPPHTRRHPQPDSRREQKPPGFSTISLQPYTQTADGSSQSISSKTKPRAAAAIDFFATAS